jgi:6-phosphogluconolactonase
MADRLDGIHFFWADERCVPPDHPDSNYAVALQHLLAPLGIPASRIHRVRGEADPVLAAREAEAELWRWATDSSGNLPVLDLVLLGMGEDGHVASLFPGNLDQDMAAPGAYHPVLGPKPPPQRITLTYAALAAAREAWVLVAGAGKEDAWRESLRPNGRTPLARMLQARRRTYLLTTLGI